MFCAGLRGYRARTSAQDQQVRLGAIGAGLLWTIYALSGIEPQQLGEQLGESLTATAQIVFFLIGAMTIVEVVDAHNGFEVITARIKTTRLSRLIWMVGFTTFFLSSILDNLTTTIVMVSLMKKLLARREDRIFFAGIIIIAANAGGAWTPIGDVTTTMLWIGGQITTVEIAKGLFLPLAAQPAGAAGRDRQAAGRSSRRAAAAQRRRLLPRTTAFERNLMFFMGLGILVAVPAFKTLTHLPPFMGILFGLGILWLVGDLVHRHKEEDDKIHFTLAHALSRIDMGSITFFIGILLSVATLEHTHVLELAGAVAGPGGGPPGHHRAADRLWPARWSTTCRWWRPRWACTTWPATDRQLPVGIHGLLRRHRRLDPDHRLGRRAPPWA